MNVNTTKNNQIRSILYSIRGIVKQNKTKVQIFFHVCAMVFKMLRTMHLFVALYSCHWLNQKLGKKEINNQVKRFPEIHLFNNLQSSRLFLNKCCLALRVYSLDLQLFSRWSMERLDSLVRVSNVLWI